MLNARLFANWILKNRLKSLFDASSLCYAILPNHVNYAEELPFVPGLITTQLKKYGLYRRLVAV
jgi:hypothetical protein